MRAGTDCWACVQRGISSLTSQSRCARARPPRTLSTRDHNGQTASSTCQALLARRLRPSIDRSRRAPPAPQGDRRRHGRVDKLLKNSEHRGGRAHPDASRTSKTRSIRRKRASPRSRRQRARRALDGADAAGDAARARARRAARGRGRRPPSHARSGSGPPRAPRRNGATKRGRRWTAGLEALLRSCVPDHRRGPTPRQFATPQQNGVGGSASPSKLSARAPRTLRGAELLRRRFDARRPAKSDATSRRPSAASRGCRRAGRALAANASSPRPCRTCRGRRPRARPAVR